MPRSRVLSRYIGLVGVSAPSLHRESTDSLLVIAAQTVVLVKASPRHDISGIRTTSSFTVIMVLRIPMKALVSISSPHYVARCNMSRFLLLFLPFQEAWHISLTTALRNMKLCRQIDPTNRVICKQYTVLLHEKQQTISANVIFSNVYGCRNSTNAVLTKKLCREMNSSILANNVMFNSV